MGSSIAVNSLTYERYGQIAHNTGVWPWMDAGHLGRMGQSREEGKFPCMWVSSSKTWSSACDR